MPILNWGMIQDGGTFESLMHAILYREDPGTILFGRPGKDAGQDARSADGTVVYQAKYRQGMTMDDAIKLALEELEKIQKYRQPEHANFEHWQNARCWVLIANFSINPNDEAKWQAQVVPKYKQEGLTAEYWDITKLEVKLEQHADIRNVFFGGENRVLVGLKEAHDLITAERIGSVSFEGEIIGRKEEIKRVIAFADNLEKIILPVVGPGGIGKTRLLYESLVSLSRSGWRVLWALPESMSRSSHWFKLLNTNQKTCVALDDPEDRGLLQVIIEQLSAVERRNWKFVVACRTEKAEILRQFRNNKQVQGPIALGPLEESESKELLNNLLTNPANPARLHQVYTYTRGRPGWMCLIADLFNRDSWPEWPAEADEVASIYVESCLESLEPEKRENGRTLLRWLSLWGVLKLEADTQEQAEILFLNDRGIPESTVRNLLRRLVTTGLIRNWGVDKRLWAVEPLIIREQILSEWLLEKNGEEYKISAEGKSLVDLMASGKFPSVDMALGTLSHLTRSRLDAPQGFSFLKPIFDAMVITVTNGTVLDQYGVINLVEKVGDSDPEAALDVIIAIRQNPKDNIELDSPMWGPQTFSHNLILSRLPWVLFNVAESVTDDSVARRYLAEFKALIALSDDLSEFTEPGKGVQQLLGRLLCGSDNSRVYAAPARDMIFNELEKPDSWPFIDLLLKSSLNPEREFTEWVSTWTLNFTRRAILSGSEKWTLLAELRAKIFEVLRESSDSGLRSALWQILDESHHQFHRVMDLYGREKIVQGYYTVLSDDLTECAEILQSPPVKLTIEEATLARNVWKWYLEYGRDDDLIKLARNCEKIYNGLSKWKLHSLFRFEADDRLTSETERIVKILREATGVDTFKEFFNEAKRYLDIAHGGVRDSADLYRISVIADELEDLFIPPGTADINVLTSFVSEVLDQTYDGNDLAWHFVACICKRFLQRTKETKGQADIRGMLEKLLTLTQPKARLLINLYWNAFPTVIGKLTKEELDCILDHEKEFSEDEWFDLLGVFAPIYWGTIESHLTIHLGNMRDRQVDAGNCMRYFIRSLHLTVLRYKCLPDSTLMAWIISVIKKYNLDGNILKMHELGHLRDRFELTVSMPKMVELIASRIQLEQKPKPSDRFEFMPYKFPINKWCRFVKTDSANKKAFHDMCRLTLNPGFIATYYIPKYVAQMDPAGAHVSDFIKQYLMDNPEVEVDTLSRLAYLASEYPDTSAAWAKIALPICQKLDSLRREEREHVYFGLSRKETGGLASAPGEIPSYFVQTRDEADLMLKTEQEPSLRGYREWALRRAAYDFQRERGLAEEDADG